MGTTPASASTLASFPAIFLRDNCPCATCRDPRNGQKLFQILDLPANLRVSTVEETDDSVLVTFAPDGHRSVFSRDWIDRVTERPAGDGRTEDDKELWAAEDLAGRMPRASWPVYERNEAERLSLLDAVARLGFGILTGTPTKAGTVLEVVSTFGFVRETNYGSLFDVRVEAEPNNLAFTGRAISPHTDNPYRDPVPTIQLLHCLSNAVEGGESSLVDGFRAAAILRSEDPASFDVLARTLVPFSWSDDRHHLRAARPLVETDPRGRIRGVRFNNRSMEAVKLAPAGAAAFYEAYRRFAEIVNRRELMVTFRLEAGDCVVFDNLRILHARTAFSDSAGGRRHLQGCYSDLDGLLSTVSGLRAHLSEHEGVPWTS